MSSTKKPKATEHPAVFTIRHWVGFVYYDEEPSHRLIKILSHGDTWTIVSNSYDGGKTWTRPDRSKLKGHLPGYPTFEEARAMAIDLRRLSITTHRDAIAEEEIFISKLEKMGPADG